MPGPPCHQSIPRLSSVLPTVYSWPSYFPFELPAPESSCLLPYLHVAVLKEFRLNTQETNILIFFVTLIFFHVSFGSTTHPSTGCKSKYFTLSMSTSPHPPSLWLYLIKQHYLFYLLNISGVCPNLATSSRASLVPVWWSFLNITVALPTGGRIVDTTPTPSLSFTLQPIWSC